MNSKRNWSWLLFIAVGMNLMRAFVGSYVGLGDDEAYYWDWSRFLGLSYYDHPGMTAWMIKIGTRVFGENPFGVRFFGLVCNGISGWMLWVLARKMFGPATAVGALLFYLFAPIFSLGGILMVPDAPMGMAWMAVCLFAWRILGEDDERWSTWLWAGAALGFGLISKYTIVLLAASIVLLILSSRRWRAHLIGAKFWTAVALAAVFCLPIIVWNVQYDWPTLKFHLHDRQTGGGGANFGRWGQFVASQAIILSPALFLLCVGVWFVAIKRKADLRWRFIFFMTLPTFAVFCTQALFAEFKPHWPAPAYTLLFVGTAELFREGFGLASETWRKRARVLLTALIVLIFAPLNILFYAGSVWPILPKVARVVTRVVAPGAPWDPKFDPTNDLFGWDVAARAARDIRDELRARGEGEAFVSSSRYQLTSQLAFALQERAWRVSPGKDQYSFWQDPDWKELVGRPSVFITDNRFERDPRNDNIFESCEEKPKLNYYRGTELARTFNIWVCRKFLGFR